MALVSPSVLSANFADLRPAIKMLERANSDMVHLDVMDGVFVPNISFGFPVIKTIRQGTSLMLDAHFMIIEPERYISRVRDCGVELMTVHAEACKHLNRTIQEIRQAGMKAGVALNPATPLVMLEDVICDIDMALIMSVNPGFGGQTFIEHSIDKVRRLKDMIQRSGSNALIEVDGGINLTTGRQVVEAGADIIVAGNFVFGSDNPEKAIRDLKEL